MRYERFYKVAEVIGWKSIFGCKIYSHSVAYLHGDQVKRISKWQQQYRNLNFSYFFFILNAKIQRDIKHLIYVLVKYQYSEK